MTVITIFLAVIVLFLAAKGVMSHYQQPELGLKGGTLQPCPDKPNCVCSEEGADERHGIAPLLIKGEADAAWAALEKSIQDMGGIVVQNSGGYMHAEFSSMIFRFVDDVEARLDRAGGVIHLRSASRVGTSDFGVNRKRLERLRQRWKQG